LADPHCSKIAPDDPRLRVRPARGRTLKKGPAVALVVAVGGTLAVSLIAALLPSSKSSVPKADEPLATAAAAPIVPDVIRNAPEPAPLRRPPPATDRLPVVAMPSDSARRAALALDSQDGLRQESEPRVGRRSAPAGRDVRGEQDLRARGAGILFQEARTPSTQVPPAAPPSTPLPPGALPDRPGSDLDPNLQARKNAFLGGSGSHELPRLEHPQSPYEVLAGTIIPAVLITAINSDLPGPVVGQVRENVYDTVSGNYLLIPQGSRLLAHYDSMVAWGQERVLVCWNRLLFPNGDSLPLECAPAADLRGAAGLTDQVDEHWDRILKAVAVASLLAATTQYVAGNTEGVNPTVPQGWAHGAAGGINQAGQQLTSRNLLVQPTIRVREGFLVNVMVTKDLVLPKPYPLDPPRGISRRP
jgi:type IV secretion system protein VirB10